MLLGTATAVIDLEIDRFMSNAARAESAMNQLGQAGGANRGLTDWASRNERALNDAGRGFAVLGGAMLGTFGVGIKAAADLEQGLANIEATLGRGATPDLMGRIADETRRIGVNSQYSAPEIAALTDQLLKAGIDVEDALGDRGATQAVVNLASATGETLPTAITGITQAMNTWSPAIVESDIAMTDAGRAADILTVAANESSAGVGDIIAGMRNIGPVAASFGVGFDEAAASVATFTGFGLKGADAGVSLARGIQNLVDPTSEASAEMERLGIDAFDAQGAFIGFPPLFDQLSSALSGATDEQKALTLGMIFGAEAVDVMGIAALTGGDSIREMTGQMGQSGVAAEQAAKRLDTLKGAWQRATEGIGTLLGTIMAEAVPGLTLFADLIARLTDSMISMPRPLRVVAAATLGIGGAALTAAGAFLLMLPRILETRAAFAALSTAPGMLGKFTRGLGRFGRFAVLGAKAFGILGLAATALYLAYQTNFLGIGDITDDFVSKFVPRFQALNQVTDPLTATLYGVGAGLRNIGLNDLGGFFENMARGTDRVIDTMTATIRLFDLGNERWAAAAGPLRGVASGFRLVGDSVDDLLFAFREGGWSAVWDRLPEELDDAGRGFRRVGASIRDAVSAIDWGGVASTVGSGLVAAFNAVPWGTIGGAITSGVGAALDFGTALYDSAVAAVQSVDWGGVASTVGELLSAGISTVSGFAVGLGETMASELGQAFNNVDWGTLAGTIRDRLTTAIADLTGFAVGIGATLSSEFSQAMSGVNWGSVAGSIRDGLTAAITGLTGFAAGIATTLQSEFSQATAGIDWGGIASAIQTGLTAAITGLTGFAAGLATTLQAEFSQAISGVDWVGLASSIGTSLGGAIGNVVGFAAELGGTLFEEFGQAINAVDWNSLGVQVGSLLAKGLMGIGAVVGFAAILAVQLGREFGEAMAQVDWGTVVSQVGTFLSAAMRGVTGFAAGLAVGFTGEMWEAMGQVDWGVVGTGIKDGLLSAIKATAGFGVGLGQTLFAEFGEAIGNIDWGTLGTGIKDGLLAAIKNTANFAGDMSLQFSQEFADAMRNVDWAGVGTSVKSGLLTAIKNTANFAGDLALQLGQEFKDAITNIDWSGVGTAIKLQLIGAMEGVGEGMWDAIMGAIPGGGGGGDKAQNFLQGTLGGIFSGAASGAAGDMAALGGGGGGIFGGLITQAQTAMRQVATTIQTESATWSTAVSMAGYNMGLAAITAFAGVTTAASTQLAMLNTTIAMVLYNLGVTVITAFAGLATGVSIQLSMLSTTVSMAFYNLNVGVLTALIGLQTSITTTFSTISVTVSMAFYNMSVGVLTAVNGMVTGVSQRFNNLTTSIAQAMYNMAVAITTGFNNAATAASNAANRITSTVQQMGYQIGAAGIEAGNSFASGIESGFSRAIEVAYNMVVSIVGAFAGLPGMLYDIGSNAGAALADGLASQVGAVSAQAGALMAAANSAASAIARISSPSKVWLYFGEMMGLGGVIGLESMTRRMTAASVAFTNAALPGGGVVQTRNALAAIPNQPRYDVPTRSGGGGQTTIYQTVITPTPSEYDRIDHDARRGAGAADVLEDVKPTRRATSTRLGSTLR